MLYNRIQADASPHTPKLDSRCSNSLSVSIVSNAADVFSHLLTWLLTILPGYLPIKLPRSYLTMCLLTCLIVLSEFDPWLNLADPPNVVLVCGSIPMALCKAVSILVHLVYRSCYTLLPFLHFHLPNKLPNYLPVYIERYRPICSPAACSIPTY